MTTRTLLAPLLFFALLQWHCIQRYVSPYPNPPTGYLVVDGYISGNSPTAFRLTRTEELPGDSVIPAVTGAHVQVEGTDNSVYPLTENGNGYYISSPLNMNTSTRYRLHITTPNNGDYASDYVPFKPTPPIDSVQWTYDTTGINFYVTTHDPTGNTRYYQWKCTETWELSSWAKSYVVYQGDTIANRTPDQQIDTCWHNDSNGNILIGTSKLLAEDVINRQHLLQIPINSEQISIEYSLLVTQYAITDSGFAFLHLMSTNTEQLGGVMDPEPSQITGNIHSLTNPGEQVIGYISAGTIQQHRLFLNRYQFPGWLYYFACPFDDVGVSPSDYYLSFGRNPHALTPIGGVQDSGHIAGVEANYNICVDCRSRDPGNSNQRPAYWPN